MLNQSDEAKDRQELYLHAKRCGLSKAKALRWVEQQFKPKQKRPRQPLAEKLTPLLFTADPR